MMHITLGWIADDCLFEETTPGWWFQHVSSYPSFQNHGLLVTVGMIINIP